MNKVILIGNVGKSEIFEGNTRFARLSVATDESYKKDGEWIDQTEWHRVVQFGKFVTKAQKGDKVSVEGKIKTSEYKDKDGVKRYSTEIIADKIKIVARATAVKSILELTQNDLPF